ncbi:Response regulator [Sulfidibacter corallicola]
MPQKLDLETRPARILVADDEPDLEVLFRQMFRKELRRKEFSFVFVYNGRAALEKLAEDPEFDMVLSDIRMPDMDGLTLLKQLRANYPLLATVMVTAYGDMINIRKAMNEGAFDFISKPIQYSDVMATIRKTLNHVKELRDLDRHRREEAQAQERLVAELRKVDRLKDEFLANTSHELRTPLNAIIGLTETLLHNEDENLSVEARQNLRLMLYSGQRLTNLINDLLDFSKLKNDDLSLVPKSISPYEMVELTFRLTETLLGGKDVRLVNELPKGVPAIHVDEYRLQQILINLVGNAIKFTERGSITVAAYVEDDWMRLSVNDTGSGIADTQLDTIFEPFYQADGSEERHYGGTGLGLSITRKLVELHGGKIGVRSKEGEGTTFWFTLPLSQRDAEPLEGFTFTIAKPITMTESADFEALPPNEDLDRVSQRLVELEPQSFHLLAVDDDAVNLRVLEQHLKDFQVTRVQRGADAIKLIEEGRRFDLVLLDVMMPQVSGIQVCRKIRSLYGPHELPVLLLTAKNQVGDLVSGLVAGANDYLTKPLSRAELIARVHTHLELLQTTRQLRSAQDEARENARAAGKAKFATSVLHNIGNILNSMNVSMKNISKVINNSRLNGFHKANRILEENKVNLANLFEQAGKGEQLVDYYQHLGSLLQKENNDMLDELENAEKKITLMKDIIETQQYYAKEDQNLLPVQLDLAVEESIAVQKEMLEGYGVELKSQFRCDTPVMAHQAVLVHILVNLIKNAIEAMEQAETRVLTIETGLNEEGQPFCRISDTGIGIENMDDIFQHGFTTKKYGHGYGLHYCAKAMEAMGGSMSADSEGKHRGAQFQMLFQPYQFRTVRHDAQQQLHAT